MATNIPFGQFASKLRVASAKFLDSVKETVEINIGDMETEAIRNAPGGGDPIKTTSGFETQSDIARGRNWTPISQAIGYNIDPSGFKGSVFVERSAGEIAAWVEFGTGQHAARYLATVPAEWKATAQRFYVNGKGTIVNQPFLFPAFMKYKEKFIKDLRNNIKNFGE